MISVADLYKKCTEYKGLNCYNLVYDVIDYHNTKVNKLNTSLVKLSTNIRPDTDKIKAYSQPHSAFYVAPIKINSGIAGNIPSDYINNSLAVFRTNGNVFQCILGKTKHYGNICKNRLKNEDLGKDHWLFAYEDNVLKATDYTTYDWNWLNSKTDPFAYAPTGAEALQRLTQVEMDAPKYFLWVSNKSNESGRATTHTDPVWDNRCSDHKRSIAQTRLNDLKTNHVLNRSYVLDEVFDWSAGDHVLQFFNTNTVWRETLNKYFPENTRVKANGILISYEVDAGKILKWEIPEAVSFATQAEARTAASKLARELVFEKDHCAGLYIYVVSLDPTGEGFLVHGDGVKVGKFVELKANISSDEFRRHLFSVLEDNKCYSWKASDVNWYVQNSADYTLKDVREKCKDEWFEKNKKCCAKFADDFEKKYFNKYKSH